MRCFLKANHTLRVTGEGVKAEEEPGVERLKDIVEDNGITPDEAHGRQKEGEAVEGDDTVRGIHHCVVCFT